jgi:serine phosphatase RsbU (regulator of sigma subunit)/anti-sigma regulatory factor (Ser/Thr protein kinase)
MFPYFSRNASSQPDPGASAPIGESAAHPARTLEDRIPAGDPLIDFLISHPEVIDVRDLPVESIGVNILKQTGVKTIVPLVAQGALIGMLNLGKRKSEQGYSLSDRRLLNRLSTHAAIALKVAELAHIQETRARELAQMERDLQVAQVIQKTLLPKSVPVVDGWKIERYWKPAQAIGGDFYDFIQFPNGSLGIIIGDVTDKGIPAALVMAETRSILRAVAMRYISPGAVLARVNDLLGPDIPERMFITCLYTLIDPIHGHLRFANAGHNLPIIHDQDSVTEIMVRGMPLGIFPGMEYEEVEIDIQPGTNLLFYSDGLSEAHNPSSEIYTTQRIKEMLAQEPIRINAINGLLEDLGKHTGETWVQEDDITLITANFEEMLSPAAPAQNSMLEELYPDEQAHILTEFSLPSLSGNDRAAMERVSSVLNPYNLETGLLQRIKTAVAETALNAIEHGNLYQPELPVTLRVMTTLKALSIRVSDCGDKRSIPELTPPNLTDKLEGKQPSRGWGLYLIKNMTDDFRIYNYESGNTVELLFKLT